MEKRKRDHFNTMQSMAYRSMGEVWAQDKGDWLGKIRKSKGQSAPVGWGRAHSILNRSKSSCRHS